MNIKLLTEHHLEFLSLKRGKLLWRILSAHSAIKLRKMLRVSSKIKHGTVVQNTLFRFCSAVGTVVRKTHGTVVQNTLFRFCSVYVYGKHMRKTEQHSAQKRNSGTKTRNSGTKTRNSGTKTRNSGTKTRNSGTKTLFRFCSVVLWHTYGKNGTVVLKRNSSTKTEQLYKTTLFRIVLLLGQW